MSRSRYVEVEVDLDYFDDEDIIDEAKSRRLWPTPLGAEDTDVEMALAELRRGDVQEAILILERALRPKWQDERVCKSDYEKAKSDGSPAN